AGLDTSSMSSGPVIPIMPELLMDRVWEQDGASPRCSSAFLAADADFTPLLCLFSAQEGQMLAWRLVSSDAKQSAPTTPAPIAVASLKLAKSFELSARAVTPVHAGWYAPLEQDPNAFNHELLVLERSSTLALYAGSCRLCTVTCALPAAVPPAS